MSKKGLFYRSGGNPPHTPGLYLDGKIIAFWPVWIKPSEERVHNIFNLWQERGSKHAIGHVEVATELEAGGLL